MKCRIVPRATPRTRFALVACAAVLFVFAAGPMRSATDPVPPIIDFGKVDRRPVPLSQTEPNYPPHLRAQGVEGNALVEFLVGPDGKVRSAHAVSSSHPEFAAAAVEAVSHWVFKPGLFRGHAVSTRIQVPILFELSPGEHRTIHWNFGPVQYSLNMRTGEREIVLPATAVGAYASQVQAARFLLTRATDDTGAVLRQSETPAFHLSAVGSVSGDHSETTSRQPISLWLAGIAPKAEALKLIEGRLEVFVPAQDPDAAVSVDNLSSRFGVPIDDEALRKAGVTLVIFDRPTAKRMYATKTPGGPQDYDIGHMFGSDYLDPTLPPAVARAVNQVQKNMYADYPPAMAARLEAMNEMGENEIAIGLCDPKERVVALEFQAQDGSPLHYNHNGRYHSERTSEKKRFDVYNLRRPLPPKATMICWLLTAKSVIAMPIKLVDIPIPEARNRQPPPAAPVIGKAPSPKT